MACTCRRAGIGALWGVGSQIVSDCIAGKVSSASDYASAAVGGAVTGGTLAATGNPTLAGAAGGAAASATGQLVSHGTVDGGQVLKDAAVGAASGGLGAGMGKAIGCGANKALKALGGAAVDATTGAGAQVVSNVLEGKPAGEGVAAAALDHAAGGVGLVAAVMTDGGSGAKAPTDTQKSKPLNSPNPEKWVANGGQVDTNWTYTDKAGNKVPYPNGHPDFKAGGHVKAEVEIQQKGNRTSDFRDATKANGDSKPSGTSWHHHENGTTMQAVDSKVHRNFTHRGGVSVKKKGKR